jgi:hypothetical protein
MKKNKFIYHLINFLVAVVWLMNGLYCKVLDFVPRHRQIVGVILGQEHEKLFTLMIGIGEIMIAIWILSRIKPRLCAIFQIILIGTMNVTEFILVPDLLLFGRLNLVFAILFMSIIYFNFMQSRNDKMQKAH